MLSNKTSNLSSFRNIPSVDEAWKLPIPAELTTRTIRNAQVRPAMNCTSAELPTNIGHLTKQSKPVVCGSHHHKDNFSYLQ